MSDTLADAIVEAATGRFIEPSEAVAVIDHGGLVGEDGAIDSFELRQRVADLAKSKPYLVKRPQPDQSQGLSSDHTKGSAAEVFADAVRKSSRFS